MRHVLLAPTTGLIAGTTAGFVLANASADPWIFAERVFLAALVILAPAGLAAVSAWRSGRGRALTAIVSLAFAAGGATLAADAWARAWRPSLRVVFDQLVANEKEAAAAASRVLPEEPAVAVTLAGVLRADAALRESTVSLDMEVLSVDTGGRTDESALGAPSLCIRQVKGGVLISVAGVLARERSGEWRAGRTVRVPVLLQRPSRYLNPGAVDEERALARRGAVLVGSVKSGALVDVIARGGAWAEAMSAGRAFVRGAVASAVGRWSPSAAGIVSAILIGDRAGLSLDVQRALQDAGTYHVVAISGGNIAILAALALTIFRLAGMLGPIAMLSAVAVLAAYASLVGGGASVSRATLMAGVYFAARAFDLRTPPLNALCLVAILIVAFDPLSVADPAFVLTCGATMAILIAGALIQRATFRLGRRGLGPVVMLLAASIAAELALMPVGATVFSRVTFAGLLLNFAAIPLMAVVQLSGMVVVFLHVVAPGLAAGAGFVAFLAAEGLVRSADLVKLLPFLAWRVAPPHALATTVYYLALGLLAASPFAPRLARLRKPCAIVCAAAACWILLEPWTFLARRGDGKLHVTFIDVGQGDAAIVTFPRGRSLLVDAGGLARGTYDVGDRVVAPVLRRAGLRRLDLVALTHGDADHIGGLPAIADEFRPSDVWEGVPVPSFEPLRDLRHAALAAGARWTNLQTGDVTAIDGVEIVVRHPHLPDWERQGVRNDDSIVLELRWGSASIVLTGDIGAEVERAIAASFAPSPLRVVKVAHHGSLSSSSVEFLKALSPRVAVVSAGRSNTFGHPAPAVLARYRDIGAEVFRTDRDGAVMVTTDGHSLEVETFSGKSESFHEDTKK